VINLHDLTGEEVVKVWIRGHADPVDSDIAVVPPITSGLAPIPRGGEATAGTQGTSDHGAPDLGITRIDAVTFPPMVTVSDGAPAHSEGAVQPAPVASALADISAVHGDVAGSGGVGGGEIARDSEGLASLALNSPDYSDHGWFIVPSADNEYGQAAYAAADGFAFDLAAGEFGTDWFVA
jgi:hypothetical protein